GGAVVAKALTSRKLSFCPTKRDEDCLNLRCAAIATVFNKWTIDPSQRGGKTGRSILAASAAEARKPRINLAEKINVWVCSDSKLAKRSSSVVALAADSSFHNRITAKCANATVNS